MRRALLLALAIAATTAHADDTLSLPRLGLDDTFVATECVGIWKSDDRALMQWPNGTRCTRTFALKSPALDVELVGGKYRVTVKDPRRVRVTLSAKEN